MKIEINYLIYLETLRKYEGRELHRSTKKSFQTFNRKGKKPTTGITIIIFVILLMPQPIRAISEDSSICQPF